MRALGYSKRQAKAIASSGFKGLKHDDPSEDMTDLVALSERVKKLVEHIEGKNL